MELYIHLPFCKSKCQYCDFNSYAGCDQRTIFSYLNALNKEIEFAGKQYNNAVIDTIYIGGGTPSLLDPACIQRISDTIFSSFNVNLLEFSIECNPESLTNEKFAAYKNAKINRISIGIQSLDNNNLQSIGRIHTAEEAVLQLKNARRYFDNVSCDLMIGLPYDTLDIISSEVNVLSALVDHISMYQLSIEDGTPLAKKVAEGSVLLPDDDEVADLFDTAIDVAASHGLSRYEVSNFARHGMLSKHNYGYWTREEYLGFGAGAHSLVKTCDGKQPLEKEIRFASPNDIHAYIAGVNCVENFESIPRVEISTLEQSDVLEETIMLGLRTTEGIDEKFLSGKDLSGIENYFVQKNAKIALTDAGISVMNSILVKII